MKKDELLCETVDPAKLDYKNPIFQRLEEEPNNSWILEEQIQFYKRNNVPIAHFAFKGQKSRHYYAIFEGASDREASSYNKNMNSEVKKKQRADEAINEHETESYDVMIDNGYDVPKEGDNPEEIIAYKVVMNALTKEYNELSEEKKRICDTIKKGMSQREAATELGISRSTYRGHKDKTLDGLAKKLKYYR